VDYGSGSGHSKKEAEQAAAAASWKLLSDGSVQLDHEAPAGSRSDGS
jgi:ribonuclease-3